MNVCTGTRVPAKQGVPPIMAGSETTNFMQVVSMILRQLQCFVRGLAIGLTICLPAIGWGADSISNAAPSFRNQVQPILAKYGCSAGACHGAAAGQNGFKLSLRGYD